VNFNVYLDDETARRLDAVAKASGAPRNALVRRAVAEWLERTGAGWPALILEYAGDPTVQPFESHRDELQPPNDDPFAPSRAHDRKRRR
jgi:hypothetical protein